LKVESLLPTRLCIEKTGGLPTTTLGINFFHPSGIVAGLTATYYDQSGDFKNFKTSTYSDADDTFWLVYAALVYRLPKRYGLITAEVTNLFDNDDFNYWKADRKNS